MTLTLETVPCLSDNYAFLAHDAKSGQTLLVDVPEAGPVLDRLEQRGWTPSHVLLTHHHWDHIGGLDDILKAFDVQVVGARADAERLPKLDLAVDDGDTLQLAGETANILDVSGHTVGHIAYHFPESGLVFTGDSLMALGCGRVFEGTFPQMFSSLERLAALPPETIVCSGHEYTAANGRFALTVDGDNKALQKRVRDVADARQHGRPTVPSELALELATNPFLRAADPAIQAHLGLAGAAPVDVFSEIRRRKDAF